MQTNADIKSLNLLIFLGNDEKRHFVDEFVYLAVSDLRPNLAILLFPCFLIGK